MGYFEDLKTNGQEALLPANYILSSQEMIAVVVISNDSNYKNKEYWTISHCHNMVLIPS
jgi:hypothetical protein